MLISQPFLSAAAHEDDPMQPVTTLGERSGKGAFPVSREFGWHGGIHLEAQGNADSSEPVRAIADGEVVFARSSDDIPQHHDVPAVIAAHPLLYYKGWTSNGVVILKHATEIGEGVNVEFYSIYQHMHTTQVARGSKVYRKDAIGLPGAIYGQPNRIHFEIVADAASVAALMGRNHAPLAAEQGRTNSLWGDIHIVLPAGTPLYASDPSVGSAAHPAWQVPVQATTTEQTIVSISESSGLITLTTRSIRGAVLGSATPEDGYGLYERATRRYPGCPSAGYEMLRFGRMIGPDAPAAADLYQGRLPHIRQIHSPVDHTAVYANLNGPGVRVYSDADFPDWLGWTFVDDDTDGNSRCDSDVLIGMLDPGAPPAVSPPAAASGAAAQTPAQQQAQRKRERIARAYARSLDGPMRERLSYCVVKMPTEWSREDFDIRWKWVKGDDPDDLPAIALMTGCLTSEAYTRFKQHHAALAFWEDAQAQGLTLDRLHYHFHPGRFIQTFRKCMWLSEKEFKQLVPSFAMRKHAGQMLWEQVPGAFVNGNIFKNQRVPLNLMMRAYGINTPLRMASFFGNAIQESQWLQLLQEGSPANQRYYPWYGRGFLQLTWPSNYLAYWDFRGRANQIPAAVRAQLLGAQQAAAHSGSNAAWNSSELALTPDMRKWRGDVSLTDQIDATFSACFYWVKVGMAGYADEPHVLERVALTASGHAHCYYRSPSFWKASASVNLPGAINNFYSTHLNGFEARCMAYSVALSVLTEMKFPVAAGQAVEIPQDNILRRS
ncbi:M23 family metallopeptidase [Paraburkholderia dilworthii]|uniref:M23 family metallopeptidase n=1 Tax=Paraburkholderia dilworthii TaxID=948106 RepID=UPI00040CF556|nr:M23 family metallopeptidase [Paraburkholderia dilworthii]